MDWSDNVARKDKFVADNPGWTVSFNKERRQFEANNETEQGFTLVDYDLGRLMDKLEVMVTPAKQETDRYQEIKVKPES